MVSVTIRKGFITLAPGGSVPMDSFHKKSQYVIVASKIIRPNTFYQVSSPNLWRHDSIMALSMKD